MQFPELQQKIQQKILVSKIIAFKLGSTNSHNLEEDNCHCQSICYRATLRFKISVWEVYSKAGSLRVMKNRTKVLS